MDQLQFHVVDTVFNTSLESQALVSLRQISAGMSHALCRSCLEFGNSERLNNGQFYTLMFILHNYELSYFQTSSPSFYEQFNDYCDK